LAAIFSNTRRSPAAIASARLRSVMSVMLARIRRRSELGRRTKRTSQGSVCPRESQYSHSNTGASPASAPSIKPRGTPNDGVPSGCRRADLAPGRSRAALARSILKNRQALSLTSTNLPRSTSNTTMTSGACSTSVR
jgi:hypothetical protein